MDTQENPPITGDVAVDEVLAKVAALGEEPLVDHVDVLKEAHNSLLAYLNSSTHEA
ncbi:MAG: hypothetical protein FWG08_07180 [Propionibacteriaceae bacterium]|nr:hypothetical protein [Propionibacteriaceae bacterium]